MGMKITLIHGQNHKGSTYTISRMLAEKIGGEVSEFFLPKDFDAHCAGCFTCLSSGIASCPHYGLLAPILDALLGADVLIIDSPTYCMEMTGQLKSLFDHLFTAWLSHRPHEAMFAKTGVAVSTAAGAGMGGVTKSIARQMFYLGIPKVYRISQRVAAMSWAEVNEKAKIRIEANADKIAGKIRNTQGKAKPGFKLMFMFGLMRQMQKGNDYAPLDRQHWEDNNWLGKDRPWKTAGKSEAANRTDQ